MTLISQTIYYYSYYITLTILAWLIGIAINIWIAQRLDRQPLTMPNLSIGLFVAITTGLGIIIYCFFFLALLHFLNIKGFVWTLSLLVTAALILLLRSDSSWRQLLGIDRHNQLNTINFLLTLVLVIYIGGLLLRPLSPTIAWDELAYHLPYAKFFLQHEGLAVNEYLRFPLNAYNFELIYTFSLVIADETLAHIFHAGCAFLIGLGIFGLCRFSYGYPASFLAVIIFFSFDVVKYLLGTAYIDLALALFVSFAIFSLILWNRSGEQRWLLLSAFSLGIGMGAKYIGAIFTLPLSLWVLFHSRSLKIFIKYALIVAVFGLPWYVRNFWISGNPVHPFAGEIFGYYLWSPSDLAGQYAELRSHGVERTLINFLLLPYHFLNSYKNQLSPWILPFFLTPFIFRWLNPSIKPLVLIIWGYLVYWFMSAQHIRYLLPILPILAIVCSVVIVSITNYCINKFKAITITLPYNYANFQKLLIYTLFLILAGAAVKTCLKEIHRAQKIPYEVASINQFLSEKNEGYELMQVANAYPKLQGQPIYQYGFENSVYFYNGVVMGDWFGPARYKQMMDNMTPEAVEKNLRKLGAKAIVILDIRMPFNQYDKKAFNDHFQLIKQNKFGSLYLLKE